MLKKNFFIAKNPDDLSRGGQKMRVILTELRMLDMLMSILPYSNSFAHDVDQTLIVRYVLSRYNPKIEQA